ncbi:MAG: hypothetical protein KBF37_10410 [Saprospiraceae bacterium]|jgi:PKD repeat protein|nr:hypothetical protein [Saprospiraceae bacterium]
MRYLMVLLILLAVGIQGTLCQENSFWLRNLSEGLGAAKLDLEDFSPELELSEGVHVMWMTQKAGSRSISYRNSSDDGLNWSPVIELGDSDFDQEKRYKRMEVSGNYVHLIVNRPQELWYYRSSNGGMNFEPVKVLFKATVGYIYNLQIQAVGDQVYISFSNYCWYCSDKNLLYLLRSTDNGGSFDNELLVTDKNDVVLNFTSLHTERENVFLLYQEIVGPSTNYDYALHVLHSNDGGLNFQDDVISFPAMSGLHHSLQLQDFSGGFQPKIASDGNRVWIIYGAWDENNTQGIYVSRSFNGGQDFQEAVKVSGPITNFRVGLETIAAKGDRVFAVFSTLDDKVYLSYSSDGGVSFDSLAEFTSSTAKHLDGGADPRVAIDPMDGRAWIATTGTIIGKVNSNGAMSGSSLQGTLTSNTRRPRIELTADGILHLVSEAGGEWLQSGSFSETDIWYRRVDPNFLGISSGDQSLRMDFIANAGDGSGVHQHDNMIIGPQLGERFSKGLTVECWLRPDTVQAIKRILTQWHKGSWNLYDPKSFQLGATADDLPVCGLVSRTGVYLLTGNKRMAPGYWNHLAVVYDNNGQANNFKMLLNGEEIASATATGDLLPSTAMWVLGSTGTSHVSEGFVGEVDELRMWSVGKTGEEIRSGRFAHFSGTEPGLEAYFDFDSISPFGEVADKTQHGHSGHLMYKERSRPASIIDMGVRFEYVQTISSFAFNPVSKGGVRYRWDFGDGRTSTAAYPQIRYEKPGVYQVCLEVFGTTTYDSYCEVVEVEGIDRIFPTEGGNTGLVTINLYGGGFDTSDVVRLRRSGQADLVAIRTILDANRAISAVLNLQQQEVGKCDVVVSNGKRELILSGGFNIVEGEDPDPYVSFKGGGSILVQRWTPQTIVVGNHANIDAHGVLLWMTLPDHPDNDVEFINLDIRAPQFAIDKGWQDDLRSLGNYIVVDSLFGREEKVRLYSFYIPILPARSSFDIVFRIRLGNAQPEVPLNVWINPPFYQSPLSNEVQACVALSIAKAFIKSGAGLIPGVSCIAATLSVIADFADDQGPTPSSVSNQVVKNWIWILGTNILECAGPLTQIVMLARIAKAVSVLTAAVEQSVESDNCHSGFRQIGLMDLLYYPKWSDDPNEKNGNPGSGTEGYLPKSKELGYQIRFENKSSASAPAHEVSITDTIKHDIVDWSRISFGPLGWGDRVYFPLPESREFSLDVDLRPDKNSIVRITGKVDTSTRVLRWKFLTLDATTMDLPTDPFAGFLPPNMVPPEGEGFVSISVGLRDDIVHDDRADNEATIIFDSNAPIVTNVHKNTFDLRAPESRVMSSTPATHDSAVALEILSEDDGSGVRFVDLWYSKDDSNYVFSQRVYGGETLFAGYPGSQYKFYSIAEDRVGNREVVPAGPDTEVRFLTATDDVADVRGVLIYPLPSMGELMLEFVLTKAGDTRIYLQDALGKMVAQLLDRRLEAGVHKNRFRVGILPGNYQLCIQRGSRKVNFPIIIMR